MKCLGYIVLVEETKNGTNRRYISSVNLFYKKHAKKIKAKDYFKKRDNWYTIEKGEYWTISYKVTNNSEIVLGFLDFEGVNEIDGAENGIYGNNYFDPQAIDNRAAEWLEAFYFLHCKEPSVLSPLGTMPINKVYGEMLLW